MRARSFLSLTCLLVTIVAGSTPAFAQERQRVDLELVLAVDVSVSMNKQELEIQRAGYAAALKDPDVLRAIQSGPHGRIAVSYFEWAGVTSQQLIVPWTIVGSARRCGRHRNEVGPAAGLAATAHLDFGRARFRRRLCWRKVHTMPSAR